MAALVDDFARLEDGYGFLLEGAQWATSIVAGGIARESGEDLQGNDGPGWSTPPGPSGWRVTGPRQRDDRRGGGARRALRAHRRGRPAGRPRSIEARSAFTRPPERRRSCRSRPPPAAGGPATTSTGSSPRCKTPVRRGRAQTVLGPSDEQCRMGDDPTTSVADPGELHDMPGVYVGDASALPTASGVNPMISTMALAHRTAEAIARTELTPRTTRDKHHMEVVRMNKQGRSRTVVGALSALAAGLLFAAGPAAADPIAIGRARPVAARLPGRAGDRSQDQGPDDRAAEPVHGAQPELATSTTTRG